MTLQRELRMARFALIIIFLALIRTLSEPFRLQYYSASGLSFEQLKPYLIGGLISAVGLLAMTILSFYAKYKWIMAAAVIVIILLLYVKFTYLY